jgi:hypothetical protein
MRRGNKGCVGGDQERVTIGRGFRDVFGADLAGAAARLVLNHHLLAPRFRQPLAEPASDHVGDAAGGKRHDDVDRFGGIGLRRRSGARSERDDDGDHRDAGAP